jgi:hypothetical protein
MTTGHKRRGAQGSAVVDFVLALTLLVPLALGVLQLALVMHVRNTLGSAASEGARYGATLDGGVVDAETRTQEQISRAISGRYADHVRARSVMVGGAPGVEVVVQATVPALGLGGPGVRLNVTGHAVTEQP